MNTLSEDLGRFGLVYAAGAVWDLDGTLLGRFDAYEVCALVRLLRLVRRAAA